MKASATFFDYTITSTSSEDSGFPASNLKLYDSATESFRTTVITESTIVIDLGSAKSNPEIILYNCNFTSVKFEGNDTDVWTSPAYESGTVTIEQDPEMRIYKYKVQLTGFNNRYLRIVIPAQTPVDSADYFEIGLFGLFESLEDFEGSAKGFGLPVDVDIIYPEQINRFQTNRKDIIPLFDRPVLEFNLSGNITNSVDNRRRIMNVFGDPTKNIIMMDRASENTWQAYVLQRIGTISTSETVPGNSGIKRFSVILETIL